MDRNKTIDVCALGHAIVDLQISVSEGVFSTLNLTRGRMCLVSEEDQEKLLESLNEFPLSRCSGGSAANSVIILSQLGGRGAFFGVTGSDQYGKFYNQEMKQLGIELPVSSRHNKPTGTCLIVITPDAERTMNTCLGAASDLGPADLSESIIARSNWLYIEGYLLMSPQGPELVRSAIDLAERNKTKIAISCSDSFLVDVVGDLLREVVAKSDLVFANAAEICKLTEKDNVSDAFAAIKDETRSYVITKGAAGVLVKWDSEIVELPGIVVKALDTTGAGDMFAGGFLYGINHGYALKDSAGLANLLASQIVGQLGARLAKKIEGIDGINNFLKHN
ncbi:MAG: adenosine kinase [Deltaproteobacteria bacterium]|nr:adenosine kinase [Deltaproteobacteria bacterium]